MLAPIICSQCGTNNPPSNAACSRCGAALAADTHAGLPDWLRDTTEGGNESGAPAEGVFGLPAWLQDPATRAGSTQAGPSLASEQSSGAGAPGATEPQGSGPEWLREATGTAHTAAPPAEDAELPPWLADLSVSDADLGNRTQGEAGSLPSWLTELEQPATSTPSPPVDAASGWLRDPPPAPPPGEATPGPAHTDLPDWLREPEASVPSEQPDAEAQLDDLPSWLRETQSGASEADGPANVPELPSWLAPPLDDTRPREQPSRAQAPGALPSWLMGPDTGSEDALEQPAAATPQDQDLPVEPATADDTLPAWLHDEPEGEQDAAAQNVPSWLQELNQGGASAAPRMPDWAGEAVTPAPDVDDQELPAWLVDLENTAQPAPVRPSAPEPPNWLDEPAGATAVPGDTGAAADARGDVVQPQAEAPDGADADGGLPAWLLGEDQPPSGGVTPSDAVPPPITASAESDSGSELPDWLREPSAAEQSTRPAAADDELPDWLSAPAGDQASAAASTQPDATSLPAWLLEMPDDEGAQTAAAGGRQAAPDEAELPPWLRDDAPQAAAAGDQAETGWGALPEAPVQPAEQAAGARVYAGVEPPETPAAPIKGEKSTNGATADLPPWLIGADTPAPPAGSTLPPWLNESDAPDQATRPADSAGGDFLGSLDLPAWLREGDTAPAPVAAAPATPAWLEGLEPAAAPAVEVAEPIVAAPRAPVIERTPERIAAMQLLNRLIAEPAPEPTVVAAPRRRASITALFQLIAFIAIVAAILAILLNPRLPLGFGAPQVAPPAVAQLSARLGALPAGAPVLLAYEWDARRSAELQPLEETLTGQLITRRAPLILMTTDPQGALLARRRAVLLRARGDNFYDQPGLGYVDLGFKPGGAVALARLAQDFPSIFQQDWAGRNLQSEQAVINSMCMSQTGNIADCSLSRVGMLVVLVDDEDDVRLWVEQVASAAPDIPVTFGAPAEIVPLIRPYVTRPNITVLGGLNDALALQTLASTSDDRLGRRADATAVAGAVFGALVLLGMLPALLSGRRARRRGKASVWER